MEALQTIYKKISPSNKLKNVKTNIIKWKYSVNTEMRERVIITQVRIDHTHLSNSLIFQQ